MQTLLSVAQRRVDRGLHGPVPTSSPYAGSDLFYILPVPQFMDRLQRPIAVLSIREVVRDANGKFDDMKEWLWWTLEMTRRVLRDWWVRGAFPGAPAPIGKGGEGCVLLVDAAGGGYRNLVSTTKLEDFDADPTSGSRASPDFAVGWPQRFPRPIRNRLCGEYRMGAAEHVEHR